LRTPLTYSSKALLYDLSSSKASHISEQSSEAAIWTATVSGVFGGGPDISYWKQRKISCSRINGRPLASGERIQRIGAPS